VSVEKPGVFETMNRRGGRFIFIHPLNANSPQIILLLQLPWKRV
jgi:hypothetical protein